MYTEVKNLLRNKNTTESADKTKMTSLTNTFTPQAPSLAAEFPTFRRFFISFHDHFIPHPRNNYHPHALSHRMLALLSLLLMTVKIAAVSFVAIAPAASVEASAITAPTIISLANAARREGGLAELTPNSLLSQAAQNKANDMMSRQYFSHNTPTGETPWTFIKAVGYSYVSAGENLATNFREAESVQAAWMNSPGHRANIMNATFQEIGIGISQGTFNGSETTIVVQMFGTPIAQKVEMPTTPTAVEKPAPAAAAPTPVVTPAPSTPTPTQAEAPASASAEAAPQAAAPAPAPVSDTKLIIRGSELVEVPVTYQPVQITKTETALQGEKLYLTVTASGEATKLIASYGDNKNVMLDPAENNQWYAYIPLDQLNPNTNLIVYAYDINGNRTHEAVAQFSPELNASLKPGAVEGASITLFGKNINPKIWEEKIILVILAALLACLVLAIAIRRHVQHVSLVANTAFVAMLAAFMLMI